MSSVALELTCAGVFSEETLPEYVHDRVADLTEDQKTELIMMLAAVSAATYEAWADDTGQSVCEMLTRSGMFMAEHSTE